MKDLHNKVAVITGGNSGIGYATAKELKASGARVIFTGRNEEKVKKASEELDIHGIVADVSDLQQIDNLVKQVKEQYGQVDILFANAGVFELEPVGSISEKSFDNQMNINFKGFVFTLERFLPILKEGSSIIALSSIAAYGGTTNIAIYSASKAAVNAYSKTAAIELAPKNIRVNVINPGPIDTPIFEKLGLPQEHVSGIKSSVQKDIPLKKMGRPEDVAELVKFLASDSSSFITGSVFDIDGGLSSKA